MPTIQKLEESKHVSGRYLVWLGEKELLRVTAEEVLSFGLYTGKELTEEEVAQLSQAGQTSGARAAAAKLVGAKPMSRGELTEKLLRKGYSAEDAESAADWLEELGVLDDGAYAAMVARHYTAKGYGLRKVQDELWRRKVPRALWAEALAQAEPPEEAIDKLIAQKLQGKTPDQRELGKVQNFLLRRGFSWTEVREGLERYGAEEDSD
ncbi:MAG: recombination regulator RecX [Clostridiales bacterium]|nr:recombination regulator RecX [Clostridiales bacterium]MCD8366920.1 recombination regulator RecX [Clostridiales bacterium]